ncbi:MAG: hypothetical protein CVV33_03560 [Methanomicrobiales archaeon HGW-Methanomicrobiales-4]|nr:MAG: hypothetical protein CVV33_03560 [Methanomicrobiales archaeon HGW-Methanomicrobiales-4]
MGATYLRITISYDENKYPVLICSHMNHTVRVGYLVLTMFLAIGGVVCAPGIAAATGQTEIQNYGFSDDNLTSQDASILPDTAEITDINGIQTDSIQQSQSRTPWNSGITPLSNLTPEQKKRVDSLIKLPVNLSVRASTSPIAVPEDLPESFDWRDNNGDWTTPVRDQGDCGSCWAHAAIGVMESYWMIKNQDPSLQVDLSEQYLVSCDINDSGCDGGDFETAMPYLVDTPGPDGLIGVVSRSDYPYSEEQSSCKDLSGIPRYRADKWAYVNASADEGSENTVPPVDELKAAIYLKGPIAVGVEDDDEFDDYTGGVFYTDADYEDTNHAVVLVGWGTEDGEEYFIGKNSVGTEWGENGWFRIDVESNRIGEGAVYLDSL